MITRNNWRLSAFRKHARYYFHTEDGTSFTDREGLELSGIRAARIEAARAIGQMVDARPDAFWEDGAFKNDGDRRRRAGALHPRPFGH
jgi:hypothetical protein